MNTKIKEKKHNFSVFEELEDYANSPIIVEKLPLCKLFITISAKFDSRKGDAAIEKQIVCAKAYFESFKETEIRKFVLITSKYRKRTKPDYPNLPEEKNVTFDDFSTLTKDEKRQYKKLKKATEEKTKGINNKNSQYEEARAFINDAESICCTRINEGAEDVNAYLAYYCKYAKYKAMEMIPKVKDLRESLHIGWEVKKDVL